MTITNGQLRGKSRAKRDIAYPVHAEVEYRLKQGKRVVEVGRSQAVSLSGSELVLDAKRKLAARMEIELILAWPRPLGTLARLVLRIQGRTAAAPGKYTRVRIGRYNFETRSEPNRSSTRKAVKSIAVEHLPHATPFAS